jgi:hypothetical protein
MKKILMFNFSFVADALPSPQLIFKKEITEIVPIGTKYLPFGNELRSGVVTAPYVADEEKNEFIITILSEIPKNKVSREEIDYIRENMEKKDWVMVNDEIYHYLD